MYKLQVIADKLNIRNTPEADPTFANWIGDMNKSEIFTAVTKVKGGLFEGVDDWFVDNLNRFVSAGSVGINAQEYISARFNGQIISELIDYNFLVNIPETIKRTKGNGIKVAILDSPINKSIQFKNQIIRPINIDHPADTHGTFIAGILAGISGISGIAPDTQLIELPLRDEFGSQPDSLVTEVFNFLRANDDMMILNISQRLPTKFSTLFNGLRNKIIVASAGMNNELQKPNLIFPSSLPISIAVGALSQNLLNQINKDTLNSKLDFIIPDFGYVSYATGNNDFEMDNGDSYSCAVVSAIIALLFSSGNVNAGMSLPEIKKEIENLSKPFTDQVGFNFLNIINPKV